MAGSAVQGTLQISRDDLRRRIFVTVVGALDFVDAADRVAMQAQDGAWSYGVLYDMRRMTTSPTDQEWHLIAGRVRSLNQAGDRGPVAIVGLANPAQVAAIANYAERLRASGVEMAFFDDTQSAEAWLDAHTPV
jgi:hypothetical protein